MPEVKESEQPELKLCKAREYCTTSRWITSQFASPYPLWVFFSGQARYSPMPSRMLYIFYLRLTGDIIKHHEEKIDGFAGTNSYINRLTSIR